jgi:type II secretory pathway component PulF
MTQDAGEGGRRPPEGRRAKPETKRPAAAKGPQGSGEEPTTWKPNPRNPERAGARPAVPVAAVPEPEIAGGGPSWWERIFFGRVSAGQLGLFCRQFAAYLDAGVDLIKALASLERQFGRTALGPVIGRMLLAVRRGDALSEAMARDPQAFDALFLSMMKVAEARGGVPETLRMLAHHYEARQNLIRQARSAMIYPIAVLLVAACVVALITVWLLPMFVSLLKDISGRAALPLPSRVLMAFSNFVQTLGWWLVPLLLVVGPFVVFRIYRTGAGKQVMDAMALRVPVFGLFLKKLETTRFARTLAALLGAGVDIGSSLDLTADVMQLDPMRRTLRQARHEVKEGSALSEALAGSRRFGTDVVAIIESGEETGKLPESLDKLADDYEEQVAYMVRNMGQLIQPLLMVVLGGIVLFIILAVLLPYISIITSLSR